MGLETPKTPKKPPKKPKWLEEGTKKMLAEIQSGHTAQKPPTEEEIEKNKIRYESDNALEKGGAERRRETDSSLRLTEKQIAIARDEMENKDTGYYYENTNINGINIIIRWDNGYQGYTIYFPDIKFGGNLVKLYGITDQIIRIGKNKETAKEVFDYACEEAKHVRSGSPYKLYQEVSEFIFNLDEEAD